MRARSSLLIFLFAGFLSAQSCTPGGGVTCTPNLNLWLFPTNYPNWGPLANSNTSTIDAATTNYAKLNAVNQTFTGNLTVNGTLSATVTSALTAVNLSGAQSSNLVYASPDAVPGNGLWRALVPNDVPLLNQNTTGTAGGLSANISESQVTNLTTDLANRALTTTTVNGHALSSNVTVSASDITTGTLPSAQVPAINLATSGAGGVTGNLSVSHLNGGSGATSSSAWFGDGTWKSLSASIPNIQITTNTTAIPAGTCQRPSDNTNAYQATTMTGVLTTSTIIAPTPTSATATVTGWGTSGGLSFQFYVTANTFNWCVNNPTGASITPGGSITWNVGAQ